MLKNRTFLAIICLALALVLCFGITPLFNNLTQGKTKIITLQVAVNQGEMITEAMLGITEVGEYGLPDNVIKEKSAIVGKYAAAKLFAGDYLFSYKLTDSPTDSDTLLRNLGEGNMAISVTIQSFAAGLSGKLLTGDVIQIIGIDEDENPIVFDELQYVEVLTTTSDTGSDDTVGKVADTGSDKDEPSLPSTITLKITSPMQAVRLAQAENSTLHAVLVYRGEESEAKKYIQAQSELLEQLGQTDVPPEVESTTGSTATITPKLPETEDGDGQ